jgi:hypothetical protein
MSKPALGTVTPLPHRPLSVYVMLTALPAESMMENCVVSVDS